MEVKQAKHALDFFRGELATPHALERSSLLANNALEIAKDFQRREFAARNAGTPGTWLLFNILRETILVRNFGSRNIYRGAAAKVAKELKLDVNTLNDCWHPVKIKKYIRN